MITKKANILVLLLLFFIGNTQAAIIDNGTYTTIDGLDWLDLNLTDGMSVDLAESTYSGWTVATENQFDQMLSNFYSLAPDSLLGSTSGVSWVPMTGNTYIYSIGSGSEEDYHLNTFQALFGSTDVSTSATAYFSFTETTSLGLYEATSAGYGYYYGGIKNSDKSLNPYNSGKDNVQVFNDVSSVYPGTSNITPSNNVGVFLVRATTTSPVPIPAAVWLFGSGLLGLMGFSQRRRALIHR